jgi:hypothetical protein
VDKLYGIKEKYMSWEYDFNLTKEDIDWLIETVKQQQEELNQLSDLYDKVLNHREKLINENFKLLQDRNMWIEGSSQQSKQIRELESEIVALKNANNSI